jgi:hypothetical protein
MALPPKKSPTGRVPPGKPAAAPPPKAKAGPPTRRGSSAAASGRAAAPAAPKNNMPLILGIAGGVVVLVIIAVVVASGGGEQPSGKSGKSREAKPDAAKKAPLPDVSALEATGKSKCEEGVRIIQPRLNPDPSSPKDRVFNDLEAGLKLLKEGLEAYKKATELAGRKYPIDEYRKTQDRAIRIFCTELETEGMKSCNQGAQLIQSCASLMTGKEISDTEKSKLAGDLKKGKTLISEGMAMLSRSSAVSGHTYETTQFQEALLVARKKLPELQ